MQDLISDKMETFFERLDQQDKRILIIILNKGFTDLILISELDIERLNEFKYWVDRKFEVEIMGLE